MDNIDIIFSFYFFTWCICTIISYIYSCVCCIDPGALLETWLWGWRGQVEHKIKCIVWWYTVYIYINMGREEGKQTWCNNNRSWSQSLKRFCVIVLETGSVMERQTRSETQTEVCESVCRVIKRFCMLLKVCTAASASHRTLYSFSVWVIS